MRLSERIPILKRVFGEADPDFYFLFVLLGLISWLAVVPKLSQIGTNIVTETYRQGTLGVFSGQNPYGASLPGADLYLNSPAFAFFYAPFAYLPLKIQAVCWALVNVVLFWLGIVLWVRKKTPPTWPVWLALIAASMELNISLLYQQVNAAILGGVLISVYFYKEGLWWQSGFLLAIVTGLKPLPLLVLVLLGATLRPKFLIGVVLGSLLILVLPFIFLGPEFGYQLTHDWILWSLKRTAFLRPQLDLSGVARVFDLENLGKALEIVLLLTTLPFLWISLKKNKLEWGLWLSLVLSLTILTLPTAESPTFVFLAPAYVFLTMQILDWKNSATKKIAWVVLVLSVGLCTLVFTDLWPKKIWPPTYPLKTLGALWIFTLAAICSFLEIKNPDKKF